MLTHLEGITEGKIFLKGKDITHVGGKALRNIYQDMQMVFQMPMESFDQDAHWEMELGKVFGIWG